MMGSVVDRWGTTRTQGQIDAIWRYHALRLSDPCAAHLYVMDVFGVAIRGGRWISVAASGCGTVVTR